MSLRSLLPLAGALALAACAPSATAPSTPASPPRSDAQASLTYLGVAGWQLTDGAHTLLFDPYFSRVDVENGSETLLPNEAQITRHAPARADGILVGHSHYDHLLDVPTIAKRTGATVVGTESTMNVARAAGVEPSHLRLARGGETFDIGPFHVRTIRALHSLTGQPNAPIPPDVTMPMAAGAYNEGGTLQYLVRFAGRTILFIGTANFVESEIEGLRPDIAIIAVGLRDKIPDYSCRLMRALGKPRLVYTNHFDAHWKPLGPEQMSIEEDGRKSLDAFADEVHACAPETKVVVPVHLQPMSI
ncbi:MBL fold metallo-hydrolase [Polyangium aurulentum]|uniref:MBL fold metallo-hydrolase n=1 Tax=Polyangium aurulentum TaxID=2567896 RepID=UPI0010ADD4FF|nr:MBL fold metallo-hydrolase [Polyangium aurulentum]UQA56364.1 MBL fold metallo-hydrolase [Polyangium aurulentum]